MKEHRFTIWLWQQATKTVLLALVILVGAYALAWLVTSCVPAECPPPRRDAGVTVRVLRPLEPDPEEPFVPPAWR